MIVIETKDSRKSLTPDHSGQARGYAMWMRCAYYIITNGIETDIWLFRGAVQQDIRVLHFHRSELQEVWPSLAAKLARNTVLSYKRAMDQAADHLGAT